MVPNRHDDLFGPQYLRGDLQLLTSGRLCHCFHSIHRQVQEYLLHLHGVQHKRRHILGES